MNFEQFQSGKLFLHLPDGKQVDLSVQTDGSPLIPRPKFPDGTPPIDIGIEVGEILVENRSNGQEPWRIRIGYSGQDAENRPVFKFHIFGFGYDPKANNGDGASVYTRYGKPVSGAMLYSVNPNTEQAYDQLILVEHASLDKETGKFKIGDVIPHVVFEVDKDGIPTGSIKVAVKWNVRPEGKYLEIPRATIFHLDQPEPNFAQFSAVDLDALGIYTWGATNNARIISTQKDALVKLSANIAFAPTNQEPPLQKGWFYMHLDNYEAGCNEFMSRIGVDLIHEMVRKVSDPRQIPLKA